MRSLSLLCLTACGRLGFDPPGTLGDDTVDPDGRLGDSATSGDSSQQMMIDAQLVDAQPAACANAIPVSVGRTGPTSTCTHPDLLDGCVAAARQEVVFKFVVPTTRGYNMSAKNPGTMNISNSTSIVNVPCTAPMGGCAGLLGTTFTAGQTVYFMVEASSAACAMIEFEIQ